MKRIGILALLAALFVGVLALASEAAETQNKQVEQSIELLQELEGKEGLPALRHALVQGKGVAIFPSVLNVAAGVGGMGGNGIVLVKDRENKWFGPSFVRLAGLSLGLQAGVEEVGIICVINDAEGLERFTGGAKFEFGADANAVAGPWGVDVDTARKEKGDAPIYTYTMSKGVFAGALINGAMIDAPESLNKEFWGRDITPDQALTMVADSRVQALIAELKKLER